MTTPQKQARDPLPSIAGAGGDSFGSEAAPVVPLCRDGRGMCRPKAGCNASPLLQLHDLELQGAEPPVLFGCSRSYPATQPWVARHRLQLYISYGRSSSADPVSAGGHAMVAGA